MVRAWATMGSETARAVMATGAAGMAATAFTRLWWSSEHAGMTAKLAAVWEWIKKGGMAGGGAASWASPAMASVRSPFAMTLVGETLRERAGRGGDSGRHAGALG